MTWSTSEIKYDGSPLLLRRPDHTNIWEYKDKYTRLIRVEHTLEKVRNSGLPEPGYNDTLADFDRTMCRLFNDTGNGIIFLIETYAGKRSYYYYTLPAFNIKEFDRANQDKL